MTSPFLFQVKKSSQLRGEVYDYKTWEQKLNFVLNFLNYYYFSYTICLVE